MAYLHLNLKAEYFDAIASGQKVEEYRLATSYWRSRLAGKSFDGILLKKGYPPRGDASRVLERPWVGVSLKTIEHPHFGVKPVLVFAIVVN
ncbi:MAG: ASCH domain-containing protein [Limnobacter sp.]